jgi:uncharacterized protein DUF4157
MAKTHSMETQQYSTAKQTSGGTQAHAPAASPLLQRKCACGGTPGVSGECEECQEKHLQLKASSSAPSSLTISRPGDPHEREADRMADAVMQHTPISQGSASDTGLLQRQTPMEREDDERLNRKPNGSGHTAAPIPPVVHEVLNSPGESLDGATRNFFERRFGYDFGNVRVHADAAAAESARSLHALAYTVGGDVVFGAGQYAPGTRAGQQLLAHELAHVLQQTASSASAGPSTPGHGDPTPAVTMAKVGQAHAAHADTIQRQPTSDGPTVRDLPIFLEKLELDIGQNLQDYGHHLYQAATLHRAEPDVLRNDFSRFALGRNVLKDSFRFAGFKPDTADKLALGTGILFKGLTFLRAGELTLDFQVDIGRGVKFETNIDLSVNPQDVTDVRKGRVNFGFVRRF